MSDGASPPWRFDRGWFVPMPAERLAALRILIGTLSVIYVLARAAPLLTSVRNSPWQFRPVGALAMLSGAPPSWLVIAVLVVALPLGVAFVLGWRWRWCAPAFACALLWLSSLRNSWGMIFHTDNLMVLHVIVLALSRAADAWSLDARERDAPAPHGRYGAPIRLLAGITVATYLIAGIAKLSVAGFGWVTSDALRTFVAYDNLRKTELGDLHSPLGVMMLRHAWMFPPLAAVSLAIELGSPLALLHPRLARWWCAAAWSFHVGVAVIMWIVFYYPMSGLSFAPFLAPERWLARVAARVHRRPSRPARPR